MPRSTLCSASAGKPWYARAEEANCDTPKRASASYTSASGCWTGCVAGSVRPKHFGDGWRTLDSGHRLADNLEPVLLAVGLIDGLPAGHRLRDLVPSAELYLHAGREPALVLGPLLPGGSLRAWYTTAEAAR